MTCLLALSLYHWCGDTTVCWLYGLGGNLLHRCVCGSPAETALSPLYRLCAVVLATQAWQAALCGCRWCQPRLTLRLNHDLRPPHAVSLVLFCWCSPVVAMLVVLSVLAMLAVQRVAVLPVTGAGLYTVVLHMSSRPVAVLAGAVCLVMPLGGLAVLLVFVDQHTLAAFPRVVLGDGQLNYMPPLMSALLRHCCGR